MKKLSLLKLNKLGEAQLLEREMNRLRGGGVRNCGCGCHYEDNYGSSTRDNIDANAAKGPGGAVSYGGSKYCYQSNGDEQDYKIVDSFNP